MTSFEDLKAKALDLAQAGAAKAKELTDIAKLNIANSAEEDTIRKAYIDLGKLYYAERGMAAEPAYVALCEKITASKAKIEYNQERIADIKAEITAEGQYTALRNQMYINSVEETEEGLVVVYEVTAPQIVNLSATNVSRAVEIRNADNESLASLTLYYNMSFSDAPSGAYAKISDDTVVFISGDLMYVIKGVTAESVAGKLDYTDLFIDATLNIENETGEPYDVSVSTSADGVKADDGLPVEDYLAVSRALLGICHQQSAVIHVGKSPPDHDRPQGAGSLLALPGSVGRHTQESGAEDQGKDPRQNLFHK